MLSNGSYREPARTSVQEMNDLLKGRMQCSLSAEAAHTGHRRAHPVRGCVAPDARASSRLLPFLVLSRRPSPQLVPLRRLADCTESARAGCLGGWRHQKWTRDSASQKALVQPLPPSLPALSHRSPSCPLAEGLGE